MSKKNKAHGAVLGVYVAPETIEAVLLRKGEHGAEIVQRFVRQRASKSEMVHSKELALALPGLKTADDADYTLEVGDGSAGGGGFLPTEFAGIAKKKPVVTEDDAKAAAGGALGSRPFALQLREILQECRTLGAEHPDVAFCIAPPDVSYVELAVPPAEGKDKKETAEATAAGAITPPERKRLLALLPQHYGGPVQEDRVDFLPLASVGGKRRFLALVADPSEPVAQTLTVLREQDPGLAPSARLLDAEPSLYTALLAHSLAPAEGEHTAIVRVGTDDTLVLFFDGPRLRHLERLRSLTSFDAPDTICSRVLLQQDEKRVGELHNVLVVSAGRGDRLLDAFRGYYPDAAVESMQRALAESGVRLPDDDETLLRAGTVPAIGIALRRLEGWDTEAEINLLPRTLRKRKRRSLPFAWHSALALLLLLATAAFGYVRYDAKADEMEELRQFYAENPLPPPPADPAVLQARVDSLDLAYATYTRALHVLDSLLVGSDKWISTMERVSSATRAAPQTWIDSFQPQGGTAADLTGYALSRLAIVDLSRRLSGAIQQITYQDIGERRVYNYQMVIPIPSEMPRAALYLRNVAEGDAEPQGETAINPAAHSH